jgi:hypothetical protein
MVGRGSVRTGRHALPARYEWTPKKGEKGRIENEDDHDYEQRAEKGLIFAASRLEESQSFFDRPRSRFFHSSFLGQPVARKRHGPPGSDGASPYQLYASERSLTDVATSSINHCNPLSRSALWWDTISTSTVMGV